MANYQIIRRLETLIHLLKSFPNCSKDELMERLQADYDITVAARTLERDLKILNTDFGIEVCYNRMKNGYHINEQDKDQVVDFLQFAGRIYLGNLFQEGLKDFEILKNSVVLEDETNFEGVQHIQPILLAIKNRCMIGFVHENYQKQTKTNYHIIPLQLREYQGRWYAVGIPDGGNHIKTFGLARISELEILGVSEIRLASFEKQLKKFDNIIGLNYDAAEKAEEIELAVSQRQYKYMKSLPLHPTQKEGGKLPGGWVRVCLFLIPNYALKMQLLKLGNEVEVLSPAQLRTEIKKTLTQTLKRYNHE